MIHIISIPSNKIQDLLERSDIEFLNNTERRYWEIAEKATKVFLHNKDTGKIMGYFILPVKFIPKTIKIEYLKRFSIYLVLKGNVMPPTGIMIERFVKLQQLVDPISFNKTIPLDGIVLKNVRNSLHAYLTKITS